MDRNNVIGFSLLAVLLVVYIAYNNHSQQAYRQQKQADSVANAKMHPTPVIDTNKAIAATNNVATAAATSLNDSLRKTLPPAYSGVAQTIMVENKKLALQFSTKGAFPISAEIKGYKTYYQQPLYLFNGKGNELNTILPINNGSVATADLYFTPVIKDGQNGDKIIDFSADLGTGKKVDIVYTLPADNYMMKYDIHLTGLPTNSLAMNWNTVALHTEKDIASERPGRFGGVQIYYRYKNENNDYYTIRDDKTTTLSDGDVHWVGLRKQYFSSVLIDNDNNLTNVVVKGASNLPDTNIVATTAVSMNVPMKGTNDEVASFNWYIGPNDYNTLKVYNLGMENMVPLGYGVFAFVKYINKYTLVPLFYFLSRFISNYVVIIVLMTLLIRLVLSFFTYKSYLSAAKMRVMKPEIDALRAKYPDDQQKFSMEQMKLYRSVGINQLGGCLPSLVQMPFFLSMYYMFPSLIEFRQQHFLWVKDLSTYDSIAHLPFSIPAYGDHVSLFTVLMTITSLFLALYNRNMTTQDPNNQMLKYMPFVMPVLFMGFFNNYAAALTFYYTLSNLISIAMQFVIQKFFIDEKAIHAQLQANKNKPATPSKWAAKLEEIQKAQAERTKVAPRSVKK